MYLTNLADVVRRSGLTVVEEHGWKTRGHGDMDDHIRTVVCHHTAGPRSGDHPSLNTVLEGRPGLAGPLSHLFLARSGTVYVVAAGLCWHAGAVRHIDYSNRYSIGIEAENSGSDADPWPAHQMDAYARLCAALCAGYTLLPRNVLGHKEVCDPPGRKVDPSFDMQHLRDEVAAVLADRASRGGGHPFVLHRTLTIGCHGDDVRAWQRVVGAKVDGDFGPGTTADTKAWQKGHGLTADGIVGPKTARKAGWIFA